MKTFTYACRDGRGAARRGALEAPGRAEAVRALKARGLSVVSLSEGVARDTGGRRRAALLLGGGAALLAAAAAGLLLLPAPPGKKVGGGGGAPSPARQGGAGVKAPAGPPAARGAPEAPAPGDGAAGTQVTGAPPAAGAPPHAAAPGQAGGWAAPAGGPVPVRGAQRRLAEALARGERVSPLFGRVSEGVLALYAEPGLDVVPHPLPDNFEEDARAALAEDIAVTDADTPAEEREKELVAWLKDDMRRFIAGGGTAVGYMEELRGRRARDAEAYARARDILNGFTREGGTEAALAARGALNAELEAAGIAPLPLPARVRRELKARGVDYER